MGHLNGPPVTPHDEGAPPAPSAFLASVPVGRFAPSPTGLLHAGSLLTAVASYCDIRARGGRWLVRIEDIDPLREQPGATDAILRSLEAHGLHHDGSIVYQSQRSDAYEAALAGLHARGLTYWCTCSRKQWQDAPGGLYPGTCRGCQHRPDAPAALRLQTTTASEPVREVAIEDALQGVYCQHFGRDAADVVLKRKEGFYAYHLAVVVDDAWQGVTDILRGIDLLDSTPVHRLLQDALGAPEPRYAHLPVIVNADGQKLSKQTFAAPLDDGNASSQLTTALHQLRHAPPTDLLGAPPNELLAWAVAHWDRGRLPRGASMPEHPPTARQDSQTALASG